MNDAGRTPPQSRPRNLVLAGRLVKRGRDEVCVELVDGLVVAMRADDCERVAETTDPTTTRPAVAVELRGEYPVQVTFHPKVYRVISEAGVVPFVFGGPKGLPVESFVQAMVALGSAPVGSGSAGGLKDTLVSTTTWYGTVQNDGRKADDPRESDEIFIP